jgi:hypothetical protein
LKNKVPYAFESYNPKIGAERRLRKHDAMIEAAAGLAPSGAGVVAVPPPP